MIVTSIESLSQNAQVHFANSDAAARWSVPNADYVGLPRAGTLAGTTGPVAYIDLRLNGTPTRLTALHELAHLEVDSVTATRGHSEAWAEAYGGLIESSLGRYVRILWEFEFRWWTRIAADKIAADAAWLSELVEK